MVKFLFSVFSLIVTASVAIASPKFEVRVADASTVRVGDPIRLGVIADIEIQDSALSDRLNNLVVLSAMSSEGTQEFGSQQVAMALRDKLSYQDLQRVSVKVPKTIVIRAKHNFFYEKDLRAQIARSAQGFCGGCEVVFEDFKINEAPLKGEVLNYRLDVSNFRQAGSFVLPLVIETSQGRNSIWVQGKVSFYKTTPVAKRMLRPGDRFAAEDFEMKRMNVSFSKDGTASVDNLVGKLSQRLINAGQVIYANDIRNAPAAVRGQIVKIILGDGSFEVVAQATAEEAGGIGQVIKVKTIDSKKLMSGTLVEPGVVKIE